MNPNHRGNDLMWEMGRPPPCLQTVLFGRKAGKWKRETEMERSAAVEIKVPLPI